MSKIFITGVSGVGKTAVMEELLKRGFAAYDTDKNELSVWVDKKTGLEVDGKSKLSYGTQEWFDNYLWTLLPDKVFSFQQNHLNENVFFCGSPGNTQEISKIFDKTICLTIDDNSLIKRVAKRTNRYPEEVKDILRWNKTFADKFKEANTIFLDASGSVQSVVDKILTIVNI